MTCSRDDHEHRTTSSAAAPLPTLSCTAESVKVLVTLLSCLAQTKRDQRVRCDVDRRGLLFTAHSIGKSLQVTTSIGRELFENYQFEEQDEEDDDDDGVQLSFALNVHLLLECLSIFGPSALATTSLRMTYEAESASLLLVVEDSGFMCECSMQVLEHEGGDMDQLEFESAFEQSAVVARCIMQSEPLRDAFAELYDLPSAASVTIAMTDCKRAEDQSKAKCLSLSATSETGSCEIAFAPTSSAFIEFSCAPSTENDDTGSYAATFHVAVLQQAFKALAHSNETFLRMNGDGFLSIQHMVESGTGDKAFVDALISPEDTSVP
uniref:Cell cycle checkpoint protein RAD1 n=1 Tax=Peronospora matthiolae TaxID=2874970 RepID=A0AAV1TA36_9STRA